MRVFYDGCRAEQCFLVFTAVRFHNNVEILFCCCLPITDAKCKAPVSEVTSSRSHRQKVVEPAFVPVRQDPRDCDIRHFAELLPGAQHTKTRPLPGNTFSRPLDLWAGYNENDPAVALTTQGRHLTGTSYLFQPILRKRSMVGGFSKKWRHSSLG